MENELENKASVIFNSIEDIKPVDAPPFFYTRLVARMQRGLPEKETGFFLLRPAVLTTALSIVLAINIIFLFQFKDGRAKTDVKDSVGIESFADAYNLVNRNVYE